MILKSSWQGKKAQVFETPLPQAVHRCIYDWLNPFWMLHVVYLASVIAKKIARVKSDIFIMINFCFENATRGPARGSGVEMILHLLCFGMATTADIYISCSSAVHLFGLQITFKM